MARYEQLYQGRPVSLPSPSRLNLSCCDCSLVLTLVAVAEDAGITGIAAKVNERRSAGRRRNPRYDIRREGD